MAEPTPLSVELDIFSGQPNPSWTLAERDAAEFMRRVEGLPETEREFAPPGLGYRGFLISGLPETTSCRVFGGIVACSGAAGERRFEDTRGTEQWLLDQAEQRGWPVP
ncbi:MAG TPA: hypothetical protein VIW24_05730 [Aldersonia sp.]